MKEEKKTLGEKLKDLRQGRDYSQNQAADILGVSVSTISAYEVDTRQPPYDILRRYAELFHVSMDYLLGDEKKPIFNTSGLNAKDVTLISALIDNMAEKNRRIAEK